MELNEYETNEILLRKLHSKNQHWKQHKSNRRFESIVAIVHLNHRLTKEFDNDQRIIVD